MKDGHMWWSKHEYRSEGSCFMKHECSKCNAVSYRILHAWGDGKVLPDPNLTVIHQCTRCGAKGVERPGTGIVEQKNMG